MFSTWHVEQTKDREAYIKELRTESCLIASIFLVAPVLISIRSWSWAVLILPDSLSRSVSDRLRVPFRLVDSLGICDCASLSSGDRRRSDGDSISDSASFCGGDRCWSDGNGAIFSSSDWRWSDRLGVSDGASFSSSDWCWGNGLGVPFPDVISLGLGLVIRDSAGFSISLGLPFIVCLSLVVCDSLGFPFVVGLGLPFVVGLGISYGASFGLVLVVGDRLGLITPLVFPLGHGRGSTIFAIVWDSVGSTELNKSWNNKK